MSVQRISIEAAAENIFSVLLDPYTYPEWLVGAQGIRSVDDSWPRPGAAFHHVVGFGPVKIADSTKIIDVSAPHSLELNVRARPVGRARARFTVFPQGSDRAEVSLEETPTTPVLRLLTPVVDPGLAVRNDASLKRLRTVVLGRFPHP